MAKALTAKPTAKSRFAPFKEAAFLKTRGLFQGYSMETDEPLYISPRRLESTSFLYTGPPGVGKTTKMGNDFAILAHDPDSIKVVIDFKPGAPLFNWCRDYCFANGLTDRLTLFDLDNPAWGFDPLLPDADRPNLHPALAAKQVREGLRSAQGMRDLSETRQLARFLFYGLLSARFLGKGLPTALDIMWPKSPLRKALIEELPLEFVRLKAGLEYIESLSITQRDSLISSTLAMLDGFVTDPTIYRTLCLEPRINLHHIYENRGILLINPGTYTSLSYDDVRVFGRFMVNRIMSTRFSRPDLTSRVFLFMDECHLGLSHDLAHSLDLGRQLGLTCFLAHQRLKQFEQEDPSGTILDAVMTDCQVKLIFGNLSVHDLEILEKETRLREFDPYRVKHITWQLETTPVETKRETYSYSTSWEKGTSVSYPEMVTTSEGGGRSHGTQEDTSVSYQRSTSEAETRGRARGRSTSSADGFSEADSWHDVSSEGEGWVEAAAQSSGVIMGEGTNEVTLPDGTIIPSASLNLSTSLALAASSGRSGTRGTAHGRGGSTSFSHVEGMSESEVESAAHTRAVAEAHGIAQRRGTSDTTSANWSRAVQKGEVPGFSESEGFSETITVTPFHELHTRYLPGSVEFFSREEQSIMNIQEMKAKGTGQVFLATPNSGEFLRVPRAFDPELTQAWCSRCLASVDERRRKQLPSPQTQERVPVAAVPMKDVRPESLRIPEVLPDEASDTEEPDECYLFR